MSHRFIYSLACFFMASAVCPRAEAQAPSPPPPASYQVWLRYRINSLRDQHVMHYDALIDHLQKLKFEFNPPLETRPKSDREDTSKNQLRGRIGAAEALKILRNSHVASLILLPIDFKTPEAPDQPVRVQFELVSGFPPDRQRDLWEQTRLLLRQIGFREAEAADQRGYTGRLNTRLSGTIPAGRLETFLKDLRGQPAGWIAPRVNLENLPAPLRLVNPIVVTEVLADSEPMKVFPESPPRAPDYLEKISPELWSIVDDKGKETAPVRLQLAFIGPRLADDSSHLSSLHTAAPGFHWEGSLGNTITGIGPAGQVKSLAALPEITAIRLARPPQVDMDPGLAPIGDPKKALALTGLPPLHEKGKRGQGVRLALIDTDFRGWDRLVKQGRLNGKTRLVDLTAERSRDLSPAPVANQDHLGHGAQCALAAALAAPEAELHLIRTDALDPYQIKEIVGYLRGGGLFSTNLQRRQDELASEKAVLDEERSRVLAERRAILDDFTDESGQINDFAFLGPIRGWVFSRREWLRQRLAHLDKLEQGVSERKDRLYRLLEQIRRLEGIRLVANPLVWPDGAPLGGASSLGRFLDTEGARGLLWFQAAGNTGGQAWTGLYRDEDRNGVMEFASPDHPLAPGQWSREWNFLGWQPHQGKRQGELPPGSKVRFSLQWREPHDPDYFSPVDGEDHYRKPLADLRIVLARQRDPMTKTLPADAFEVVARSQGQPQRLLHLPHGSVYEQSVEATLTKGGRYAVRIERPGGSAWVLTAESGQLPRMVQIHGLTPTGIRPLGAPTLPALEKQWELKPRLLVQTLDDANRVRGRVVLGDFATPVGTLAMPGDARNVITVGAADWKGQPQPWSASGPPAFVELAQKPTVLAHDLVLADQGPAYGTSLATAYAAGVAATLKSSGMSFDELFRFFHQHQGQALRLAGKQ